MGKPFSEVVIEGPFILVKGFLMGFLCRDEKPARYFFHRKFGIRRETLRDILVELFELENLVHLCLEDSVLEPFKQAVGRATPKIGLKIRSIRKIKEAKFRFSFEVYNETLAEEIRRLGKQLPEGVQVVDFQSSEEKPKESEALSGYSMMHHYVFRGAGYVQGDFEGVMDFFLMCKRSSASEFILTDKIELTFAD